MLDWLLSIVGLNRGFGVAEVARRLDISPEELHSVEPSYHQFSIPKRSGGRRTINAPSDELKKLQRAILHLLLARLKTHHAAVGFEPGESFVTNAARHCGKAIVVHFDLWNFFPSTSAERVHRYFRRIGWNRQAARLLTKLVTWNGQLPQGAPTSPRLSNLVNYRLDVRLSQLCDGYHATYTRYADDITISLDNEHYDLHPLIAAVIAILRSEGYEPHLRKKFSVRRQHHQQRVTGLVVNDRVNLSRETRRWLRAVEHRVKLQQSSESSDEQHKKPTLSLAQLDGWRGLVKIVEDQRDSERVVGREGAQRSARHRGH